ncbi:hypothetical protein GQ457_09G012610 [Hibiscus cannabinus]
MGSNYAPQNSWVSQVNARVDGVNSHLQLITGNANGRPPDASLPVVSHPRLERQATPVCVEDQQSVKLCRGDGLETLWRTSSRLNLVRFANAADVTKVLMGGPWLIYGNYLTVQPWSRSFSTDEDHLEKIVVWARLPGLPFLYYTKSMFRCIAGAIGKIIKIDYNTSEGKRGSFARLAVVVGLSKPLIPSVLIDGISQKIEYEGLPIICYSCGCYGHTTEVCKPHVEKELERSCVEDGSSGGKFGPWMQAPTRKLRRATDAEYEDNGTVEPVVDQGVSVPTSLVEEGAVVGDKISGNKGSQEGGRVMVEDGIDSRNYTMVLLNGSGSKPPGGVSRTQKLDGPKAVVSNEIIVPSKVSLNSNNHVAVRVVERGSDILSKKVTGRKATNVVNAASIKSGQPLSIGKNVVRKGATFKHKQQHRAPTQVTLGDWIGNLSREISSGIVHDDNQDSDPRDGRVSSEFDVHWKVNTTFDSGLPQ